jgi:hypothetical protein
VLEEAPPGEVAFVRLLPEFAPKVPVLVPEVAAPAWPVVADSTSALPV